jgi:hypothetical protein
MTESPYHQYYKVRKHFVVNYGDGYEVDVDLKPVVFSLPDPPQDWKKVKNYGLHPDDQIYRTDDVPKRLLMLENEVVRDAEEKYEDNRNKTITGHKLLRVFWRKLSDEAEMFAEEIDYIRKVIWKRYYGEWVFIDGQMMWFPPRYYMYLNFWHMSVKNGYARPEFRIRDWKSACVNHYLRHTTEALGNLNKKGMALKKDGKYKVKDLGVRTFYGPIRPKNRRSGATHEALNEGHETVCTGIGKKASVLSKSVKDVEEFFDEMLFPSWRRMPMFLKPTWIGAQVDGKRIEYKANKTSVSTKGMDSVIYYNDTTDEVVLDSKRLDYILLDEQGKKTGGGRVDVAKRYGVSKQTLSTGNGASIHGFCMNPSTAEEMEDGAKQYKAMCDMSNFYQRSDTGQTKTGLMLVYFPAQYCLEGFVDCFGKAVVNNPTRRQIELTAKHCPNRDAAFINYEVGARSFLLSQRNQLLASGKPDDLREYRNLQRKHPMRYAESWIGESGDMGFPIVKMDTRIAEIESSNVKMVDHGKFRWKGSFGSGVQWVPLAETDREARFEFSYHIQTEFANRRKRVKVYNGLTNRWENQFGPSDARFILGGDTFGFDNKTQAADREDKSRKSDGGISGYYPYDDRVDGGKNKAEWDSDRVILTYRAKPSSTDAYNEDLLMAAIYLGGLVYPERNITNTWEYFIKRGFGGYLKHDINLSTGKPEDKPGYWMGKEGKTTMFQLLNDYFERNAERERHLSLLLEGKGIRGPEYLQNFDLLAATGAALMGARDMDIAQTVSMKSNTIAEAYAAMQKVF